MLLFDIGANIGIWAKANSSPDSQIISVEASPITFDQLSRNLSSYSNITTLHYAVSPTSDPTVTFYHCNTANTLSTLDKDWLSSTESRFGYCKGSITEVTVPTISIDKLIENYGIPDLLKIDVEGAENIVLQSLTKKVPLLCFEWASEWKEKNIQCVNHLVSLGFTEFALQYEDNYTFRPSTFDKSAADIIHTISNTTPKKEWGMIWTR
jgi:FkbM family methyltransferase